MARYSIGTTKTTAAAAGLIAQLRAASAARDLRLYEVGLTMGTAVGATVVLNRPTAVGATFTTVGPGVPEDNVSGAGSALVDTAAGTAPTLGAVNARQIVLPATPGAGVIWQWPAGFVVPSSMAITLWQTSTVAASFAFYFVYDE